MKDLIERLSGKHLWRIRDGVRRRPGRKPPKGSAPAMAEPPRGPMPLSGGAAAPLEFDA